ncbi:serine protease snake-like [Spodoptera litura]|uniref:Serine protease snake-like n=1 Tax=Spodoptera litura TaxID=69820 RepID=A0A9J7IZ44_SPOLT|nr:serine protease snake-like [Spodoptera litura]
MVSRLVLLCFSVHSVVSMYEGDTCTKEDGTDTGICTILINCSTALDDLNNGEIQPQICSFPPSNIEPIVCCFNKSSNVESTTQPAPTPASRLLIEEPHCGPVKSSLTSPKTGRVAFDKCVDYQEKYVYSCGRAYSIAGGFDRRNNCHHKTDQLVVGGTNADEHEFPHMALIGFGEISSRDFQCGGSIISEKFVLTAAHCSFSTMSGPATYIAIGVLQKHEAKDQSKIYLIKRFINHPHYRSPSRYNDIALIETDREMELSQYIVPACLPTEPVEDAQAIVTGWGPIHYNTDVSDILQKATLYKTPVDECRRLYRSHRLFTRGFDSETQTCYGDRDMPLRYQDRYESKDTCPLLFGNLSYINDVDGSGTGDRIRGGQRCAGSNMYDSGVQSI